MTKLCRAEATLSPDPDCSAETLAAAKLTGQLAARKASDLAPFGPTVRPLKTEIEIALGEDEIRIDVAVEAEQGGEASALFAATAAAQTLADLAKVQVVGVRPAGQIKEPIAAPPYPRKPAAPAVRRPTTLMGEVVGPKPKLDRSEQREAFRTFMTDNHLRITDWCKSAGVAVGVVYSYLAGRSGSLPADAAEKLAKAANVRVDDLFR